MSREPLEQGPDAPPLDCESLISWLSRSAKPDRSAHVVGTEQEKFGLWLGGKDRLPTPISFAEHIAPTFEGFTRHGWRPTKDRGTGGEIVALERDGASLTLEPGGQFELSGKPLPTIHDTCAEFTTHFRELDEIARELQIAWLATGFHPFATREEINWMPKPRYAVMGSYLPTRGSYALDMMLRTCTVQANFDFMDERQCGERFRLAMGVSGLVTAIFANSPFSEGKDLGYASLRSRVWSDVDPDRCGLLPFAFEDPASFSYEKYVRYALAIPMFFVRRGGVYHPYHRPFREFLRDGFTDPKGGWHRANFADWELHLSTLFPEVRLKPFIEVRGGDSVGSAFVCALPALWKGILYDDDAGAAAWELVADLDFAGFEALWQECRQQATRSPRVQRLASRLIAVAREGLDRIDVRDSKGRTEARFLDRIETLVNAGKCPAEVAREVVGDRLGRGAASRCAFIEAFRFAGPGTPEDEAEPDA
ncbi:MAG: glutamate--cysteine ligase [Myxococcales bacterium]|nr:glutamate--cysteine ligase [Myxococcales bacterium]